MRLFIVVLFLIPQITFAQAGNHPYYFTITGDTALFPVYCVGDSTHFCVATFKARKEIILKQFSVKGHSGYSVPENILKEYRLNFKGVHIDNDSTKTTLYIKEKVVKNNEIGFSNDMSQKLYEIKVRIDVFYKNKLFLKNFTTTQNYDANKKKDFKTEKFYRYNIVRSENNTKYFVTISPYKHHPENWDIPWETLDEFRVLIDIK